MKPMLKLTGISSITFCPAGPKHLHRDAGEWQKDRENERFRRTGFIWRGTYESIAIRFAGLANFQTVKLAFYSILLCEYTRAP